MSNAREKFIAIMVEEFPSAMALEAAYRILRNSATMQRLSRESCARTLTDAEERRYAACGKRIADTCKALGTTCNTNGDPRGFVVMIKLPSGRSNNMGGEMWGVPA